MIKLREAPVNLMGLMDYIECVHCGEEMGYTYTLPLLCPKCNKSVPFARSLIHDRLLRIKYHREGTIYNAKVHS